MAEYVKAPEVTRERLYLDTMQQIYQYQQDPGRPEEQGNLLYLPLDKLMQMSGTGVAEPLPQAKAADPAPADSAVRNREAFRSRDREAR